MGKKYLETKKDSLESSVLGVWKTAIEEGDARMDGRTKEYREHRKKWESARQRRESKKATKVSEAFKPVKSDHEFVRVTVKKEQDVEKILDWLDKNASGGGMDVMIDTDNVSGGGMKDYSAGDIDLEGEDAGEVGVDLAKKFRREAQVMGEEVEVDEQLAKIKGNTPADQGRSAATQDDIDRAKEKGDMKLVKKLEEKGIEDSPNPANKQHLCAKNVVHEEWGTGQPVHGMHAEPDEDGNIAWYDVIFEHGVEKGVSINELKVTKSEGHMHASYNGKKKKKVDESAVNPKDRDELDDDAKDSAKKMKRAQEPAPGQMTEAQSGDKEAYKKFFDAALKKFKVKSPAEFKSDEEKKKFYDYIDKNWEGDNEKAEGAMSQVREFKIQSMKAALAQVWGMEEGKNPFAPLKKEDDESELKKKTKTETGKKAAVIDLNPKIKD